MDETIGRFAFLVRASETLSSSLDYEQILQQLAAVAIPTLGDLCIVDVVEDGSLRRVATAHVNPQKRDLLDQLRIRYPASEDSPQPAGRVLRSGTPELLVQVTPEVVAQHSRDAEHAALIRAIGIRSHLAVPLMARGVIAGVISLGITETTKQYGDRDLRFAEDLARLAALAVDNARLYRAAHNEVIERRRAEEALRLSEERFRAVMEQSPLSTQIFDPTGRPIGANRAWERLWGVTLDLIPEYNILDDPQLEALGIAPLIRRAFGGETVDIPAIRYDPNATIPDRSRYDDPARWVRAFAYPVKDSAGAVREVVLVHQDVTAERHAQEQLRASEERLRLALAAGRMNVWQWDLRSGIVECSENAREFWGMQIGRAEDFIAVVHPDDREALAHAALAAQEGNGLYHSEYRLLSGEGLRWAQSRGRVDRAADGTPARILGVTIDITDLKFAQEASRVLADAGQVLGASLDYRATLQHLSEIIVPRLADWCAVDLVTEAGALERVSVVHSDPSRVALARELFQRFPPRRSASHGAWHVIATGSPEWIEQIDDGVLEAVAYDGEHLELIRALGLRSYIAVPLIARGATLGVLTLVQAESGRRYQNADVELAMDLARRAAAAVDNARLYQQLREEDRRKDEFLATLAHELRNPLAPIRTGLALLRMPQDAEATERTRQIIERQVGHMVRLIDDLLDLSRVTLGKVQLERERIDLSSVVQAAVETSRALIDAAGLQFTVRLPAQPVMLDADRTRLAQVLSNLLNNAAKYTDREGRVDLWAEVEAGAVVIRVADTGIGIPREMLSGIFEMFVQSQRAVARSSGGLGIGLTLVRRLVELHGGRVWAESDGPGRGSTFVVRLPAAVSATPSVRPADGSVQSAPSRTSRRILVVDDNLDACEMLSTLLQLDGHDVRTATSGPEALEIARQFRPELAFLDIGLPGMNGFDLARRLRDDPALVGLTLAAVTGWGQPDDRRRSREAGFDYHLTKPVDPRQIRELVTRMPSA